MFAFRTAKPVMVQFRIGPSATLMMPTEPVGLAPGLNVQFSMLISLEGILPPVSTLAVLMPRLAVTMQSFMAPPTHRPWRIPPPVAFRLTIVRP